MVQQTSATTRRWCLSRGLGAVSRQADRGPLSPSLTPEHYSEAIVEAAERRALLDIGHAVVENACDPAVPLAEILPRALHGLTEFATPHGLD